MKSLLLILTVAISTNILAQGPCQADIQKNCPNIEKNKKARVECLTKFESKLSQACKDRMKIVREKIKSKGGNGKQKKK
jgi:hypothetical protein